MGRTADYTIQGFLYQFNKTLLEVLNAAENDEVSVEGIIEDIEVMTHKGIRATQCKYHEAKERFSISVLFKPLLQFMQHYHSNQQAKISYVLFAHFPNPPENYKISANDLQEALDSRDASLKKYCRELNGKIDLSKFLQRVSIQFGPGWGEMIQSVHDALVRAGIPKGDVDTLAYPNAIQTIANLSINHDAKRRRITRAVLLSELKKIKCTAISRWTLALKTKKQILEARRKQLKSHLAVNSRLRYLIVDCTSIEDFDANFVGFMCDFLAKYNVKPAHVSTPVLCLDATEEVFRNIQYRLYQRGVVSVDGYVGLHFDETRFFRPPMMQKGRREFQVRILRWKGNEKLLSRHKGDDLFVLGKNLYSELDTKDVCVEVLEIATVKECAFLTGVSNSYE